MKAYWDSSALVQATIDPVLRTRLREEKGFTRTHALSETFAALTGNPKIRFDADYAAQTVELLAEERFSGLTRKG